MSLKTATKKSRLEKLLAELREKINTLTLAQEEFSVHVKDLWHALDCMDPDYDPGDE